MKPLASLSLDLDNKWSYMKTHGDAGWESFPSYLGTLLPRALDFFGARDLQLTFFVVGQDAVIDSNREFLAMITRAGHEVGNHSFNHEPWLGRYDHAQVSDELQRAQDAIEGATGTRPIGFRGPGFACSKALLQELQKMGFLYDASTFPTYVGPAARTYYFMKSGLTKEERKKRDELFGTITDGLRPLRPYLWDLGGSELLEIPVTTMPLLKTPFHLSYILYLSRFSPTAALAYFKGAMLACVQASIEPSLLVHPLDFLGGDEVEGLDFFPGMNLPGSLKRERVSDYLACMSEHFRIVSMGEFATEVCLRGNLKTRTPDFNT